MSPARAERPADATTLKVTDDVYVRARPDDLDDLVRLRQENGRVHAELELEMYRISDANAVREHFAELLQAVARPRRGACG